MTVTQAIIIAILGNLTGIAALVALFIKGRAEARKLNSESEETSGRAVNQFADAAGKAITLNRDLMLKINELNKRIDTQDERLDEQDKTISDLRKENRILKDFAKQMILAIESGKLIVPDSFKQAIEEIKCLVDV